MKGHISRTPVRRAALALMRRRRWHLERTVPGLTAKTLVAAVSILNVIDGCIPSDLSTGSTAEIEEERRLLYVAMTRAKDHLHLLLPQRFFAHQQRGNGDRHMYTSRTRFI